MSSPEEIFDRLQMVVVGENVRDAWPAAANLIATMIITGAEDKAHVDQLLDRLRTGVASTVNLNWDDARAQIPPVAVGRA